MGQTGASTSVFIDLERQQRAGLPLTTTAKMVWDDQYL